MVEVCAGVLPCEYPLDNNNVDGPQIEEALSMCPDQELQANDIEMATLNKLAHRPAIDIEFQDLSYSVRSRGVKGGRNQILKSLSGKFRSGEITAILGPSGAGKSTLMDVLVGYISAGVMGSIKTNGRPRQMRMFNKLSTYIMQEDLLQPRLTVQEALQVAASLKLGNELTPPLRTCVVNEIINSIGLEKCRDTRTEKLSGGQRKRLSIALELVNNPPVIFLDEPTTGLDVVCTKQCVALLKSLARQGRTIVCTIHQPSATLFKMFDQVYVLARGQCVYQGTTYDLVPTLASAGFQCPTTYNPADYVIQLIQGEEALENIKILAIEVDHRKYHHNKGATSLVHLGNSYEDNDAMSQMFNTKKSQFEMEFPTSFLTQFSILLRRMMIQTLRNRITLWIQLIHHVLSGTLIGLTYFGTGNSVDKPFANYKFFLCIMVFYLYTHVMTPILIFPMEYKILQREYFNRWYGLKSFYMAKTLSTLPSLIILGMLFSVITYAMSGHPWDFLRFLRYSLFCLMSGVVSESMGLVIGTSFSITNGSLMGPAVITPNLALAVYGIGHGLAIETFMQCLMNFSYLRFALVGLSVSTYGFDRPPMMCNKETVYCHYENPKLILRDLGMGDASTLYQFIVLIAFMVLYRFIAFLTLRCRLTTEFSNRILNYMAKILRHK